MKEHAEAAVSDEQLAKAGEKWSLDTPDTKEAYWIREVFESASYISFVCVRPSGASNLTRLNQMMNDQSTSLPRLLLRPLFGKFSMISSSPFEIFV